MDLLKNVYIYSAVAASVTAALGILFMYAVDPVGRNGSEYRRSFVRVFVTALLVNMSLQYFMNVPEPVSTEPYAVEAIAAEL